MIKIRVSSKGQVVIPVEVRERYSIVTGTELELREGPGYLTLHPLPQNPVAAARGLLRASSRSRSLVRELLRERRTPPGRDRGEPASAGGGRPGMPRTGAAPPAKELEPAGPEPSPTLFSLPPGPKDRA